MASSASADFTPVADLCTAYCRTGANMGMYRISDNTSKTSITFDVAFPYDIAVNDTFVYVPMRACGPSYVQFDAEATYIEGGSSASLATNYFVIDVIRLDLKESGKETCLFRFNVDHFAKARA